MNIEGQKIRTKIGSLTITRNIAMATMAIAPIGGSLMISTPPQDNIGKTAISLGITGAVMAYNGYIALKANREIKQLKKKNKKK